MQEMVYGKDSKLDVLHSGVYKGHGFAILNLGTHPTAYVECKFANFSAYDDERFNATSVHGGFTYLGTPFWEANDNATIYVGWDYAHWGDYVGFGEHIGIHDDGKRWTTSEILEEVQSVVDQLLKAEAAEIIPPER